MNWFHHAYTVKPKHFYKKSAFLTEKTAFLSTKSFCNRNVDFFGKRRRLFQKHEFYKSEIFFQNVEFFLLKKGHLLTEKSIFFSK